MDRHVETGVDPDVTYVESPSAPRDYATLFATTGWNEMYRCGISELEAVLASSWAVVSAYEGASLVGSGRLVSDGVLYAVVFDMVVAPTHQRKGIGSEMLRRLLRRCEQAGIRDVLLFSARGVSDFYAKFGFAPRSSEAPGMIYRRAAP